jgi:hypothetical protein
METKKQSPEKSCLPMAATLPSAMNGNFGTSPLEKRWPQTIGSLSRTIAGSKQ